MVGALPSNRCETCRKRKVKCDGTWPVCGPCQRSKRVCPPRPSLKFIDDGAKIRKIPLRSKDATTKPLQRTIITSDDKRFQSYPCVSVSMSESEILSGRFAVTLRIQDPSFCLGTIGQFIYDIPQLLGHSNAINSATLCLISSYENFLRGCDPCNRIPPHLYSQALRSLQQALNDPNEWDSLGTLSSAILLHRLEALFGNFRKNGIKVHASGLAALLQKRGPPQKDDLMEFQANMDSHLSITQHYVSQREDSFLANPEWADTLDMRGQTTDLKTVYFRLMRSMTVWPTLVRESSLLATGDTGIDIPSLSRKASDVLNELQHIEKSLDQFIYENRSISEIPSRRLDDPLPTMFEVRTTMAAMATCHLAIFSIVVCRILISLRTKTQNERPELEGLVLKHCHRVWKLIEYSRLHKPLGLPAMQAALIFTFASAHDESTQRYILEALNDLDSFRRAEGGTWSQEEVLYIARSLHGS